MNSFLGDLAVRGRKTEEAQRSIDDGSLERIDNALSMSKKKRSLDLTQWGGLAPTELVKCFANDEIINWTLQSLLGYSSPADLFSATQTAMMYVNSHIVADELRHFKSHDTGSAKEAPPYSPQSTICQTIGFSVLREKALLTSFGSLYMAPRLEILFLPLCCDGHFSSLVYSATRNELMHYDSSSRMHEELAMRCSRMLKRMSIIPLEAPLQRPTHPGTQSGSWQCGYVVAAFAAHCAGKLAALLGEESVTIKDVISDDEKLLKFVRALREHTMRARRLRKIATQLNVCFN